MASKFGGIAVDDAPAPSAGGSKFGGVPVNDNASVTPSAPAEKSAGGAMLDDFTGEIGGSFDQLKKDWMTSLGGAASKEENEKWAKAPFWDQMKQQFNADLAAGKLPMDAFNVAISPLTGLVRATLGKAGGHLMRAPLQGANVLTGRPMDEHVPTQQKAEDDFMSSLTAAAPERGFTVPPKPGGSTFSHIVQRPFTSPEEFAENYARHALKRDSVTAADAKAKVSKPGMSLSDLGSTSVIEAGEQAALKGEGRRLGSKLYYDERMKGRKGRVATAVDQMVSDKNMYEALDAHMQARETASDPLYEEAFKEATSTAPFRSAMEDHHANAIAEHDAAIDEHAKLQMDRVNPRLEEQHRTAQEGVREAERKLEAAKGKINFAQEASWTRDGLKPKNHLWSDRAEAQSNLEAAKAKLKAVEGQKEAFSASHDRTLEGARAKIDQTRKARDASHERLSQAYSDEATGVRGGIWSPRLQEFLNDPIVQMGLQEGMRTQQLKALAAGKPFNPKDFAIVGEEGGKPVVSKVPNLRALDAAKRGLDGILEGYRDKTTLKLVLDQRGEAINDVRKALVKELDELTNGTNPAYKKAREAYAGPSAVIDAVRMGREWASKDSEQIKKIMDGLSEDQKEGYRIGVARDLTDGITSGARGALTTAKRLVDDTEAQKSLRHILGDAHANQLIEFAEAEVEFSKRGSEILGGSPTARRNEAGKEFSGIGPVADELISAARGGMSGALVGGKRLMSRYAGQWIDRMISGMSDARREALAKLLFSTDKEDNMHALEMLYDEGKVTVPGYPKGRAAVPAIAGADANNQQQ